MFVKSNLLIYQYKIIYICFNHSIIFYIVYLFFSLFDMSTNRIANTLKTYRCIFKFILRNYGYRIFFRTHTLNVDETGITNVQRPRDPLQVNLRNKSVCLTCVWTCPNDCYKCKGSNGKYDFFKNLYVLGKIPRACRSQCCMWMHRLV